MHVVAQHQGRVLLSFGADDFQALTEALAARATAEVRHKVLLARIRDALLGARQTDELADAWADGGSVQVKAITIFGDPLDMSSEEARAFAARISSAATQAE